MDFGRVVTAMVTPFNEQGIDEENLPLLIEHLISNGTDSVVVAGTTGESPTLTHDEKLRLFERVVTLANGRIRVIAGTGTNDTASSIRLAKEAEACGVDGLLLVAPYYNKPSQEGLYQHFRAIAASTAIPIMLYNIPGRTSININAETILRLAEIDNIVAVKESSGNLSQVSNIIRRKPRDFRVYSGDDYLLLPILAIGGHGIVSVASHVAGKPIADMISNYLEGRTDQATELHNRLLPLFEGLFITSNPVMVKFALNDSGIPVGGVRLPLVRETDEQRDYMRNILQDIQDLI
ncbi:4-hydroxy-tetrahydrodipicolinate synthase [Fodinisporobacter ferrooxydans]|uniref:4-hydroxy-tetrahydrodipicolinate synthase n=1 Tax=Fodinisporobacter ferrooxydans TaxID=2901836 RepID=A0ABY4CIX2_9BACL|nr:4-hydroxy-tetrahydrodipicolinate synthase [Alicyclobacillaceae bacterium MYW30-H2]